MEEIDHYANMKFMHELKIVTTLTDSIMTTQTTAYCMTHLSRKAITMGGIMRMGAGRTILVITVSRTALSHTYTQRERERNELLFYTPSDWAKPTLN